MANSDINDDALSVQPGPAPRVRSRRRRLVRGLSWAVAIPVALFLLLWLILLVRPIPLPFVGDQARAMVMASMEEDMDLELGDTYLALENAFAPVIRFSPVSLNNRATNAQVDMEALEIGFSPARAVLGQPGVVVTMIGPHLQIIQDLLGPRMGRFEIVEDPDGGLPEVQVLQGEQAIPNVSILSEGLSVGAGFGANLVQFRSDNDWLAYNLASSEVGMRQIVENAEAGLFSRLIIKDATVDMHDVVYGVVRTFTSMQLDIAPDPVSGDIEGEFSAVIAGQRMVGQVRRYVAEDGIIHMVSTIQDADFSSFAPMMDDPASMVAIKGTGDVVADITFTPHDEPQVLGGEFTIDLSGTSLRMQEDYFPVSEASFDIVWDAARSRFDMTRGRFVAGQSSANMSGTFVLGLDQIYGPNVRMSMRATDVLLHPNDLPAPAEPISEIYFEGWSSPLYNALGIDQFKAQRGDMTLDVTGRADMLRNEMGFDINVAMQGATADDLKRLWPYMMGTETRDWFVSHITGGRVTNAAMNFSSPLGAVGAPGEDLRLPETSRRIALEAENVAFIPVDGMQPILSSGISHLDVNDTDMRIAFGDAAIDTPAGALNITSAIMGFATSPDDESSAFEISGDVGGPIGAVLEVIGQVAPDALASAEMPFSPTALSGDLATRISLRSVEPQPGAERINTYSLTGSITDFASAEPIEGRTLNNGNLAINVDNDGYLVSGPAQIDGLSTELTLRGEIGPEAEPEISIAANFTAEDLKEFGFDASDILGGTVGFQASPLSDGGLRITVDLADASLNIADLGLSKPRGQAGQLSAIARFEGNEINISGIDLGFGTVRLQGSLEFDQEDGLRSADFTRFAISEGDDAQLHLSPINDGFAVRLRGAQLDLKPILRRLFSLEGGGTGGAQATAVDQSIELDVQLERALGFYSVTAFNLAAEMGLRGSDIYKMSLQANFGGASSVSVTSNPITGGRSMSVAFSDLGTLLRFADVYSQIAGGNGSLVLNTDTATRTDRGQFTVNDFAIIDEENVAQILGNHSDSRQLIARENRLDFESGSASFVRHPDKIELTDAVLDGTTMGGTARGFIYTDAGQYDLTGTYVPLFSLNNAFQQIPILGRILGGRDGEGLIGVTFAVRGPLDDPQFLVNPASLLLPGVFRSLMEFRTRNQPQVQTENQ